MSSAEMAVTGFWLAQGSTYNGFTCPVDSPYPCFVQYGATIPVSGTFSATLAGFNPTAGATANLSVTTTSSNVALPAGADVVVTNTGANTAYIRLTVGAGTAVTTDLALVAGAAAGFHILTQTFINAITASSTTTVNVQGGTGLVTGYGGGSSSGGGGGAVTIADGASVTLGAKADAKSTATDTTPITAMSVLKQISASVQAPPSQAVTNAGTFAVQVSGVSTAANQTNVQAVIGAATAPTTMNAVGGVYNSTPLTLTNGQSSALQLDANGYLDVNIKTGASSGAVAQGSTTSGQTGLLVQGAVTTAAPTYTTAQTSPLSLDTAGALRVNVTSATGVAQASTSSGQTISPIGVRTLSTTPTDTTAQTNMPVATVSGSLVVLPYGLPDNSVSGLTAAMTGTTSTAVTGVGATASKFNYITSIVVGNSHATVGTFVEFQDGSGGTTFFTVPAAAVYGGCTLTFPKALKQPTANTALYVKNTTTGANVIVSVVGYQAP